jgi:cysteine-rich repeat protein
MICGVLRRIPTFFNPASALTHRRRTETRQGRGENRQAPFALARKKEVFRMTRHYSLIALSLVSSALIATASFAAGTPEQKCASAKMKAAGKALSALSKCQSKALGSGTNADSECLQKAGEKFQAAFDKADDANECILEGDAAPIAGKIQTTVSDITSDLGCGNGRLDGDEACDDDGLADGDGCDSDCQIESGYECVGTPSTCTLSDTCGSGVITGAESCDDGGMLDGDGCSAACQLEAGYMCTGEPSVCTPVCGDGVITGSEACDDQDTDDGDGCNSDCMVEIGFICVGEPSVCTPI